MKVKGIVISKKLAKVVASCIMNLMRNFRKLLSLCVVLCALPCFAENSGVLVKRQKVKVDGEVKKFEVYTYKCDFVLDFAYSGYGAQVVKEPFSKDVIYKVKAGDQIPVEAVISYKGESWSAPTFAKVQLQDGSKGYIYTSNERFFENGDYSYIRTMKIDGKPVDILKHTDFYSAVSENIYEEPSEDSKVLHKGECDEDDYLIYALEISRDYKWCKIRQAGFTGWVKTECLSKERGGPKIDTPETRVKWVLIWSNEI